MKKGTKVQVMNKKKVLHEGEYLGMDALGAHCIGVLKTSIKGITKQPGKKYISIFRATEKQLREIA